MLAGRSPVDWTAVDSKCILLGREEERLELNKPSISLTGITGLGNMLGECLGVCTLSYPGL